MKTIVIYSSLTGFTEKYAKWLGEDLNCSVRKLEEVNSDILADYVTIVYGGSLHATGVFGLKKFMKKVKVLEHKTILIFAVGAAPEKEGLVDKIREYNKLDENIKLFYLRGGFDLKKLPKRYQFLMGIFVKMLKWKKLKTEDDLGMIAAFDEPVDFCRKDNLKGIREELVVGELLEE